MFRRRTPNDSTTETSAESLERLRGEEGKGRPTPRRSAAEAARKKRMTPPRDRREAAARQRQQARSERGKTRSAMQGGGDDRYLPRRDRGPVRRFCRDFVDSRRNAAEFLLPALVVILMLGFIPTLWARSVTVVLWMTTILLTVADTVFLLWRLGKQLGVRFPDQSTKGARLYSLLRSSQMRFLRMPKTQVKPGANLPGQYR